MILLLLRTQLRKLLQVGLKSGDGAFLFFDGLLATSHLALQHPLLLSTFRHILNFLLHLADKFIALLHLSIKSLFRSRCTVANTVITKGMRFMTTRDQGVEHTIIFCMLFLQDLILPLQLYISTPNLAGLLTHVKSKHINPISQKTPSNFKKLLGALGATPTVSTKKG